MIARCLFLFLFLFLFLGVCFCFCPLAAASAAVTVPQHVILIGARCFALIRCASWCAVPKFEIPQGFFNTFPIPFQKSALVTIRQSPAAVDLVGGCGHGVNPPPHTHRPPMLSSRPGSLSMSGDREPPPRLLCCDPRKTPKTDKQADPRSTNACRCSSRPADTAVRQRPGHREPADRVTGLRDPAPADRPAQAKKERLVQ